MERKKWTLVLLVTIAAGLLLTCELEPRYPEEPGGEESPKSATTFESALPDGFLWGVATSGFQVEGGDTSSQWAKWVADGRTREKIYKATDFIHRYPEDVGNAAALGVKAFRISIEWARLEPQPGIIDRGIVAYYDRLIETIYSHGMEPVVTLLHFSYPQWLEAAGGWESPLAVARYLKHVARVVTRYKDKVRYWITFNEPNLWVPAGWLFGIEPPGKQSLEATIKVAGNVIAAHRGAYDLIHRLDSDAEVSATVFCLEFADLPPLLQRSSFDADWFCPAISDTVDFVSLDYYYRFHSLREIITSIGRPWLYPIDPEGLYDVIVEYDLRYGLPILITENGMATYNTFPRRDGWTRPEHLRAHVKALQQASEEGANVIGYLYWSITDNYEWGEYDSRFGLYSVNCRPYFPFYLRRRPADGVEVYRQIIINNGVAME